MNQWLRTLNSRILLLLECQRRSDVDIGRVVIVDACNVRDLWLRCKRQSAHRIDSGDSTSSKDDEPSTTVDL